ncbi:MAG TPA: glucokinase [Blastocatellia bacterium]|nr:glucokinase [Blastocatellia bacterium]
MILAGDIGGTKTNLGLFEVRDGALAALSERSFPSREYVGLETIVTEFVRQITEQGHKAAIKAACFGVAGPVTNGECVATNLPWVVSARNLARVLQLDHVELLNDLEITAHGVSELKPDEMVTLNEGVHARANAGLIAAGTGLGVACLFWDGTKMIPSASEGGHVDFAPQNQLEIELLQYLMREYGHVSVERIVSGMGIPVIYQFLKSTGYAEESPKIAASLTHQDQSKVISQAALSGECEMCVKTLDMFTAIYGATAGNLALTLKALGGIYIGGGIAPKIISKLKDGTFMGAFLAKGRFTSLLASIPVRVIMNDKTALLGAARVAAGHL